MKRLAVLFFIFSSFVFGAEPNSELRVYLDGLLKEAKSIDTNFVGFSVSRGEEIFSSKHKGKNGELISCTSCHNSDLTQRGRNISTNKVIEPLAPSVNPTRLTDVADVRKWLRRNFKDVYLKEGSAQQKGDVLVYILSK